MNENLKWSIAILESILSLGIDHFILSPGLRSSPLILALTLKERQLKKSRKITILSAIDERAAAYLALGYVKVTKKAAVLICTSGTALSNYYPAILEANKEKCPLLLISADRPPEAIHSDANQTLDQVKFFQMTLQPGNSLSLPAPQLLDETSLRALTSDIIYKLHQSLILEKNSFHLNTPFREPLLPKSLDELNSKEIEKFSRGLFLPKIEMPLTNSIKQINFRILPLSLKQLLLKKLKSIQKEDCSILIGIGKFEWNENHQNLKNFILSLSRKFNVILYQDILSQFSNQNIFSVKKLNILNLKKLTYPIDHSKIKLVLHFGGRVVDKNYLELLVTLNKLESIQSIQFNNSPLKEDPSHFFSSKIVIPPEIVLPELQSLLKRISPLQKKSQTFPKQNFNRHSLIQTISKNLPSKSSLFLGNSLTIRLFNNDVHSSSMISFFCNRGVSGIEGQIATFIGTIHGHLSLQKQVNLHLLVLGDISFLYDLNSLSLFNNLPISTLIIVLNNQGGGIFSQTRALPPESDLCRGYLHYIETPHSLHFKKMVEGFGLQYKEVKEDDFEKNFVAILERNKKRERNHTVIEVTL